MAAEFPDGAWFVELADLRQPDLVISRVAAVLGVSEEPGRPLLETVADVLCRRRLLLALDNCEHLIDACAEASRQLLASSAGLRLVITSREPLRVAGETVWRVPPLSAMSVTTSSGAKAGNQNEAVRLFAARAAAVCPDFTVGPDNVLAVAAVCRALDGLPLAIELAAAWIRVLSVDQICARLGNRFALLTTGDRSASPRQRTLRATIEWSYALLTERERTLFRRLSVFAGWSLEMAEQVCADDDIPVGDMLDLTAALVDKSLVVLERPVTGGTRATPWAPGRRSRSGPESCERPNSWPAPRSPSCGASTSGGAWPGSCSGSATWPGFVPIQARRTTATWRRWPSSRRSAPGRRSRAAWPASGGWPWTSARSSRPGAT